MIYDGARIAEPDARFFDPRHWAEQGALTGSATGRGSTHFFRLDGEDYALRHYMRGGVVRHLSRDRYLWSGLDATRAWREFRVLAELASAGLPVPAPIAAHVQRTGLCYRADIVTALIPATLTLADRLSGAVLDAALWTRIGATLRKFHVAGLDHADLNAHNILLDDRDRVYVIDFDRAVLRSPAGNWQRRNLQRLRRSLLKLAAQRPDFGFDEAGWDALQAGYRAS